MSNCDTHALSPIPTVHINENNRKRSRSRVRDLSTELFQSQSAISHAQPRPVARKYLIHRPRLLQTGEEHSKLRRCGDNQDIEFGPLLNVSDSGRSGQADSAEEDKQEKRTGSRKTQKGIDSIPL